MEKLYTCIASCQICGTELNRAEHVPEHDTNKVSLKAPFVAICKVKHHNTFSDCNIGVKLEWMEEK